MLLSSNILRRQCYSQGAFGALFSRSYRARGAAVKSSPRWSNYRATLRNLKAPKQAEIVYQVLDGKTKQEIAACRKLGTNIIGAIEPASSTTEALDVEADGEELINCFGSLESAQASNAPEVLIVNSSNKNAPEAIKQAIERRIRLVVVKTESVPSHEMLRIIELLTEQNATRLLGPGSSAGIISPANGCYIGGASAPSCYKPGKIAIVSRSASLCHEAALSLREAGLGQSICIGLGDGSLVQGTTMTDALEVISQDPETDGILLIGSVGGDMEWNAAKWIEANASKEIPLVALVAGWNTPVNHRSMGHLGTFMTSDEVNTRAKRAALRTAGVTLVSRAEEVGPVMRKLLPKDLPQEGEEQEENEGQQGEEPDVDAKRKREQVHKNASSQSKRGYHTFRFSPSSSSFHHQQRRSVHYFTTGQSNAFLQNKQLRVVPQPPKDTDVFIGLKIGRADNVRTIEVHAARHHDITRAFIDTKTYKLPYPRKPAKLDKYSPAVKHVLETFGLPYEKTERIYVATFLHAQQKALRKRECSEIATVAGLSPKKFKVMLEVHDSRVGFDEEVADRRLQFNENRHKYVGSGDEVEKLAKASDMIYRRFDGDGKIGVLGNSTGQILSSIDNISHHPKLPTMGCANFINTTTTNIFSSSKTLHEALSLLTRDPRVKIIFVNLFHPESAAWCPASPKYGSAAMIARNFGDALKRDDEMHDKLAEQAETDKKIESEAASEQKDHVVEGDVEEEKEQEQESRQGKNQEVVTESSPRRLSDIPIVLRIRGPGDEQGIKVRAGGKHKIYTSMKFEAAVERLVALYKKAKGT